MKRQFAEHDELMPVQTDCTDADAAVPVAPFGADPASASSTDPALQTQPRNEGPHDYTCPICLDLLLRPIALSCGHLLCRGCWIQILQDKAVRAVINRTGAVACPLGRCEVKPIVPKVDVALARELQSRYAMEHRIRIAECNVSEDDEARTAAEVNAWVDSGTKLDKPEQAGSSEEVAAAVAAVRNERSQSTRCRRITQRMVWTILGLLGAVELGAVAVLISDTDFPRRDWLQRALLVLAACAGLVLITWVLYSAVWVGAPTRPGGSAPARRCCEPRALLRRICRACCRCGCPCRLPPRVAPRLTAVSVQA